MSEIKLLPCPFCGSDKLKIDCKSGRINHYEKNGMREWQNVVYSVRCNKCHARGGTVSVDLPTMGLLGDYEIKKRKVIEACINAWNTRKPMQEIVEKIKEKLLQSINNANDESIENGHTLDFEHYFGEKEAYEDTLLLVKEVGGMNDNN